MPPEDIIQNLEETLPREDAFLGNRKIKIFFILFISVVAVAFGVFYFSLMRQEKESNVSSLEEESSLTDAKTGKPISKEEINRISAEQKSNARIFVFSGDVVSVNNDMIGVKYGTRVVAITVGKDGKIFQINGKDEEGKPITADEVKKDNFLTAIFSRGMTDAELLSGLPIPVKNIKIFTGVRIPE